MSDIGFARVESVGSGMRSVSCGICRLVRLTLILSAFAATTAIGTGSAFAAAPSVEEEFAQGVSSTSATLHAKINPGGSDTTYRFEYGTSQAYGSRIPVPDQALGFGKEGVSVASHVQGLEPSTTYHYRVVAINPEGEEGGADQTFTTQPAVGTPVSANGRQWELVSPPTKHGALVEPITYSGSPVQAAADGDAMSFATDGPTEKTPEGSRSPEMTEILSTRGPAGWSPKDIQLPSQSVFGLGIGIGQAYRLFSTDLSQSIVEPREGTPLLSPEATERTLYLRDSASALFKPLLRAENVAKGVKFAGSDRFQDATPDLSHVIIESPPLTENAVKASPEQSVYEWTNGQVKLVSILPDTTVPPRATAGSTGPGPAHTFLVGQNAANAVSSDGSRVVFQTEDYERNSHIYLRDTISEETVQLDAPQGGPASGSSENGWFEGLSSDGNHVFFAYDEQLTKESHAQHEKPDLYEFNVEPGPKLTGHLTDLSVDPNSGEAADVQGGIPGAGEDGSYVYFVAQGRLTNEPRLGCLAELSVTEREAEEKSQEGRCRAIRGGDNLYVSEPDAANPAGRTTAFIATLTPADEPDWLFNPSERTSRVSPNGRYVAFMSDASLTGYDNVDAAGYEKEELPAGSGKLVNIEKEGRPVPAHDEEVYIYDASMGRLSCASCNPTGERPTGIIEPGGIAGHRAPRYDSYGNWQRQWLAANVPAWTGMTAYVAIYQSRYLSNDGQLFFNSSDALVPTDTNGQVDVYEYIPAGGGCSVSATTYSPRSGGCVNLISSGTSSEESAFLDASESGEDVFFETATRLAGKDYDNSYDVYDAHLCSSEAPCITEPSTVPPCTTADSCREAPGAQPSTFGPPSSVTFSGAGNVAPATVIKRVTKKAVKCEKEFVRDKKGKCVQKKSKKKAKRASNDRRTKR